MKKLLPKGLNCYRLATQAGGVGLWDADLIQGTVQWNDTLYGLLGLPPRPGPEKVETFFDFIHPDDREQGLADFNAVVQLDELDREFRIVRADGRIRWLCGKGRLFRNAAGQPVRMRGVNYDITDRKTTEAALAGSRRQLEAKLVELSRINAELNEYAYVVAHDLKAPLRAIHNYVDFLNEDLAGRLDDQCAAHMSAIQQSAAKGDALISDLLAFSRIGSESLQHRRVALSDLAHEAAAGFSDPPRVRFQIADDFPVLCTDASLMSRILENLISNAIKFNTSDPKRVEVGWRPLDDEHIEIFVRDNGIGIDPLYHAQIFRVFQRLHGEGEYSGTGIGLAIIKKAANTLGGEVRVESSAGQGSTFFVRLPLGKEVKGDSRE